MHEHPAQPQAKLRNFRGQGPSIGIDWLKGGSGSDANGFVSRRPVNFGNTDIIPLGYYIALLLICAITTLVTLYHQEIVHFLRPAADWMHEYACSSTMVYFCLSS